VSVGVSSDTTFPLRCSCRTAEISDFRAGESSRYHLHSGLRWSSRNHYRLPRESALWGYMANSCQADGRAGQWIDVIALAVAGA
jgi:hypothetical protein